MIRILIRLYPSAWRERYGAELAELVSATGLGPRVALDLLRGALFERRRSIQTAMAGGATMVGPAWRHPNGWAITGLALLAPTLAFVIGSILAYQLGVDSLRGTMDDVNRWLASQPRVVDLLLVLAPAAALLLASAPLLRVDLRKTGSGRQAVVAMRLRALNLLIAALALTVGGLLVWHFLAESILYAGA